MIRSYIASRLPKLQRPVTFLFSSSDPELFRTLKLLQDPEISAFTGKTSKAGQSKGRE
jgi:hypothetical protein